MQEYLNMFRYIVFSFLVADLILNVDGCPPTPPIKPEKEVGGNVYEILKLDHRSKIFYDFKIFLKYDYS